MQDAPTAPELTAPELTATDRTAQVTRGVGRLLRAMGYGVVTEFGLRTGRRVDLFGLAADGRMVAVEVKTSVADFRGDAKWPEYLDWCDAFYFAVPAGRSEEHPSELQSLMRISYAVFCL